MKKYFLLLLIAVTVSFAIPQQEEIITPTQEELSMTDDLTNKSLLAMSSMDEYEILCVGDNGNSWIQINNNTGVMTLWLYHGGPSAWHPRTITMDEMEEFCFGEWWDQGIEN